MHELPAAEENNYCHLADSPVCHCIPPHRCIPMNWREHRGRDEWDRAVCGRHGTMFPCLMEIDDTVYFRDVFKCHSQLTESLHHCTQKKFNKRPDFHQPLRP